MSRTDRLGKESMRHLATRYPVLTRYPTLLLAALLCFGLPAGARGQAASSEEAPVKTLVHITHGPEAPTRAALGMHVAKAALEEGHDVTVFLAGDAVVLLREGTVEQMAGLGTGELGPLYEAVVSGGADFYLSGGSSRARSLAEEDLRGLDVEFGSPRDLVRLAAEHDRMFTY